MAGTHWKGPLLGAHNSAEGLYENFPADAMGSMEAYVWKTSFLDHTLAQYWTQTNVVAGTAAITQEVALPTLSLTHNVANQGPSVRWLGTDGRGNTIGSVAANNSIISEYRLVHQVDADGNDAYAGFMTSVAAHPLDAAGAIAVAAVADGIGWHWLAANLGRPVPVIWAGGVAQALTNVPTFAASTDTTGRYFGVRVDIGATTTPTRCSWYLDRRLVHRHNMAIAFSGRMTWGMGLIANQAAPVPQFNCDRLVIGRLASGIVPPE